MDVHLPAKFRLTHFAIRLSQYVKFVETVQLTHLLKFVMTGIRHQEMDVRINVNWKPTLYVLVRAQDHANVVGTLKQLELKHVMMGI